MDKAGQFERGAKVRVTGMDEVRECFVWEDCGDSVLICSERQYEALSKGWNAPMPIGFRREDVTLQ